MRADSARIRTLVLNADFRPLSSTNALRGLRLCEQNMATALETSAVQVHSEHLTLTLPSVIVLAQYRKSTRQMKPPHPTRASIFYRDGASCQYCGSPASTLDHVHPRSRGGTTSWENVVACCNSCNQMKGSKLLSQTTLELRSTPKVAHWSASAVTIAHAPAAFAESWTKYLVAR
jgi:5-methylcytosine-specific restriction endonuclease McrA